MEDVLQFKEAIPITKYNRGCGRHAVAKKYNAPGDKVAWPQKATRTFLDLLRNAEANAEVRHATTNINIFSKSLFSITTQLSID